MLIIISGSMPAGFSIECKDNSNALQVQVFNIYEADDAALDIAIENMGTTESNDWLYPAPFFSLQLFPITKTAFKNAVLPSLPTRTLHCWYPPPRRLCA